MKTIVLNKRNLQSILQTLRGNDYITVAKIDNGYQVTANQDGRNIKKGDTLLKAMNGSNGYLVQYKEGLLLADR